MNIAKMARFAICILVGNILVTPRVSAIEGKDRRDSYYELEAQSIGCQLDVALNKNWVQAVKTNSVLMRIPFDVLKSTVLAVVLLQSMLKLLRLV